MRIFPTKYTVFQGENFGGTRHQAKNLNPFLIVLGWEGGGVYGKAFWLIAYMSIMYTTILYLKFVYYITFFWLSILYSLLVYHYYSYVYCIQCIAIVCIFFLFFYSYVLSL